MLLAWFNATRASDQFFPGNGSTKQVLELAGSNAGGARRLSSSGSCFLRPAGFEPYAVRGRSIGIKPALVPRLSERLTIGCGSILSKSLRRGVTPSQVAAPAKPAS